MATSTVNATTPKPLQTPDSGENSRAKQLFIRDSSGVKREMTMLSYDIIPGRVQDFPAFFDTNVLAFYKKRGATDVHSWMVDNRLFVVGTPEINVPWLPTPTSEGIAGLENFIIPIPDMPPINELTVFP